MRDRPLLTESVSVNEFAPEQGSVYVYGTSPEERSSHLDRWLPNSGNVQRIEVMHEDHHAVVLGPRGEAKAISLRSSQQLRDVWISAQAGRVYLDITGLSHHVWAPLLKSALQARVDVAVVYVEPLEYRFARERTEGEIFDLSERINGIAPIPGFASLAEPDDESAVCFIPLLGFEGPRFAHLLEQLEPPSDKIVPIIGVPGFRPEYPFFAYHGNKTPLLKTDSWKNVRYAIANCPFSLFYALHDIAADHPGDHLKIAPIGTKPHALGAVLFHLSSRRPVELVYDHPVRKPARTAGTARLLVYRVSLLPLPDLTS